MTGSRPLRSSPFPRRRVTVLTLALAGPLLVGACTTTSSTVGRTDVAASTAAAPSTDVSASVPATVTAEPTLTEAPAPGSVADWDIEAGPVAVATRIDTLSSGDVGVRVDGSTLTLLVAEPAPEWLADLQEAAAGSTLTIEVQPADFGRRYLLSAAQELLPQVLPLGVTGVAPSDDQGHLVVSGTLEEDLRAGVEALAADLEYPVEVSFADN